MERQPNTCSGASAGVMQLQCSPHATLTTLQIQHYCSTPPRMVVMMSQHKPNRICVSQFNLLKCAIPVEQIELHIHICTCVCADSLTRPLEEGEQLWICVLSRLVPVKTPGPADTTSRHLCPYRHTTHINKHPILPPPSLSLPASHQEAPVASSDVLGVAYAHQAAINKNTQPVCVGVCVYAQVWVCGNG